MCWGFECRDGWEPIIRRAAEKLEVLIKTFIADHPDTTFLPTASQVKEKYGTLRFYLSTGNDEMYAVTDQAEIESEATCETCGEAGQIRGTGWLYTACNTHTEEGDR